MPPTLFEHVLQVVGQLPVGHIEALIELRSQLDGFIAKTAFPGQDHSLDASYVCYNMARGPMGFDFLTWLIYQEMTRIREGAPAPLKVGLWRGTSEQKIENPLWVNRVYRPLIKMLGAVEDTRALNGQQNESYVPRDIVRAVRAGEAVPKFSAPAKLYAGAVTITLREAEYYPQRNSRVSEWYRFGLYLKELGERVIFVRDTNKAHESLAFQETFPAASLNLETRASLYAGAKMNFFVSNGPSALCSFSDWPYMIFIPPVDNYIASTPQFWDKSSDMKIGDNWPWAGPNQRLIWDYDLFENMLTAWDSFNAGTG